MTKNRDANMKYTYGDCVAKNISFRALRLIEATLDGLQPTIDVSPDEIEGVRYGIRGIVRLIASEYDRLIPNKTLAREFHLEADNTDDILMESELRSLVVLIEGLD